jgi:Leucine-rich repeat (LRR) protein
MTTDAYRTAEQKIEKARQSAAKELDLSGEGLPKLIELPESLGQLTQLRSLNLSGNQLATLPEWLGRLTQLQSLNLSSNQLATLPEWLGRLTQLQSLNLSNNEVAVLPEWLGRLTQLQSLALFAIRLKALPEWLGQLTKLQSLNLSGNQLVTLPESLGQLTELQSLDLSDNQLAMLPESLGQLIELQSLDLSSNQLATLPDWLGRLTQLRSLDLYENGITALPRSLGQLAQLQTLRLGKNQLRALPEWLGRLTQLRALHVWKNPLTNIPAGLAELPQLARVSFNSPILAEPPDSLFDLRYLTWLDLSGSESLSRIPDGIGRLGQLERLDLTKSKVAIIPDTIGRLSKLEHLALSGNRLTDIPVSLAQLKYLKIIDLNGNPLNPELDAAHNEGIEAIKRYLRAKLAAQVKLNEAKLILIGEGEVGKSCLLGALRGDPWVENNPTTHGIEIKPVKVTDPNTGTEITLNGWDFGGQRVYRPTHQLFFSAPAVYLVVWKPREGPQQGFVKEWITLIKHRAPEAKILVVATHGGPKQRQPDIDRQEIWWPTSFSSTASQTRRRKGERVSIDSRTPLPARPQACRKWGEQFLSAGKKSAKL